MKAKWIFITLLFLCINIVQVNAQSKDDDIEQVRDDATREAFITFHKRQLTNFEIMQRSEGTIAATQQLIKEETQQIETLKMKVYNSLAQVNNLVSDIRSITYIYQDLNYTLQYIEDCYHIISEHPEYLLVTTQTEAAIVNRMEQLEKYLIFSLTSSTINLMNSKERLEFISKVSTEMRIIKGYANYLKYELQLAVKNGFWRSMFPNLFVWESRIQYNIRTCENIITNFRLE